MICVRVPPVRGVDKIRSPKMEYNLHGKTVWYFTIPTVVLVIVTSLAGLLYAGTYSRETALWVAQAAGQDIVNIALIVPAILISAYFTGKGRRSGFFVWLGAMLYTTYTFVIYSFGLHFNSYFLIYCWTLGVSAYAFVTLIVQVTAGTVKGWFDEARHEHIISILVLAAGVVFYLMWLKDDLPAMISNQAPVSLQETGLPTNPVHVLDYSLILPGFIVTSILLLKKNGFGYLFAPVLLTFGILMYLTIAAIIIAMRVRGTNDNLTAFVLFVIFAAISIAVLVSFLKHMKKPAN